jgi:5-methylcytosine-specific restriction endonuclease McrA
MRAAPPRLARSSNRRLQLQARPNRAHYDSLEHKAWRRVVRQRAGQRCQGCGRTGCRLFADHIVELRDGGDPLDLRNGQALCGSCHAIKTAAARASRLYAR